MAKPKSNVKKTRLSIYVRDDVKEALEALLEDPLKPGKLPYGAFNVYMNTLIANDLREKSLIGQEVFSKVMKSLDA